MSGLMIPFAILTGLVLAGVALSLFALYRAMTTANAAEQRAESSRLRSLNDLAEVQERYQNLSARLQDLRREPPSFLATPAPKAALNLSKRSQALRMHRHGDSPGQIAAELDVPPQEIDLLIKVHRIVLSAV